MKSIKDTKMSKPKHSVVTVLDIKIMYKNSDLGLKFDKNMKLS